MAHSLSALDAMQKLLIACKTLTFLRMLSCALYPWAPSSGRALRPSKPGALPQYNITLGDNTAPDPDRMACGEHLNHTHHTTTKCRPHVGAGVSANQFTTLRRGAC